MKSFMKVLTGMVVVLVTLAAANTASAQVKIVSEYEMGGGGQITLINLSSDHAVGYVNILNGDDIRQEMLYIEPCGMVTCGRIDTSTCVTVEAFTEGRLDIDYVPAFGSSVNWRYRTAVVAVDSGFIYNPEHWVEGHGGIPEFVFPCGSPVQNADDSFGTVKSLFR